MSPAFALAAVLTLSFSGAGVAATSEEPALVHGAPGADTIQVAGNPMEAAALQFARAWAGGSSGAVAGVLTPRGVRLQLDEASHTGLSSRQASAAIREFLRSFDEVEAALMRATLVADATDRGSAVIQWSARMAGTSQRVDRILFLGLVRVEPDRWQVDEVRLVR